MKIQILRSTAAFAVAIGGLFAAAPPVSAESMSVHVPFAFTAGTMAMPAGDYRVGVDSKVLSMQGEAAGALIAIQSDGTTSSKIAELEFDLGSGTAVLARVTLPSGSVYIAQRAARVAKTGPLSADGVVLTHR